MRRIARRSIKIFCSYSHTDKHYLAKLRTSLDVLKNQGLIEEWHDRKITPGEEWDKEIDRNLQTADIILLLVSPEFLSSNYIREKEIELAMEKHARGEARVVPIIVRPSYWENTVFGKLQALPEDGKPVIKWSHRDDAWLDVVRGIEKTVEELAGQPSEAEQEPVEIVGGTEQVRYTDNGGTELGGTGQVRYSDNGGKEPTSLRRYREGVSLAWWDRKLSSGEVAWLNDLASNKLGLSPSTAADIERQVMGDTKEVIRSRRGRFSELRGRSLWIIGGMLFVVLVSIAFIVYREFGFSNPFTFRGPDVTEQAFLVTGRDEKGNGRLKHTEDGVDYAQDPPVGGEHSSWWQNEGFYESPVPNERAVHTMEHGAVWITYDPGLSREQRNILREIVESEYCVLASPYPNSILNESTPVVASSWGRQMQLHRELKDSSDPDLIAFIRKYRKNPDITPERGGSCEGGTSDTQSG